MYLYAIIIIVATYIIVSAYVKRNPISRNKVIHKTSFDKRLYNPGEEIILTTKIENTSSFPIRRLYVKHTVDKEFNVLCEENYKINKDIHGRDSLALTANKFFASPVANWSVPFYLAGYANQENYNTVFYYGTETKFEGPLEFPVELSADKDTITIKGFVANSTKYYPNVIGEDYSIMTGTVYILDYPIVSDVVLTRGWNEDQQPEVEQPAVKSASWGRKAYPVKPVGKPNLIKYSPRSVFEKPVPVKTINYDFKPYDEIMQSLEKYRVNRK